MLVDAIDYAKTQGWSVFPVSVSKTPYVKKGFQVATTDERQIRAWWNEFPYASIGIATGVVSDLVVLDIDPKNGGSLEAFEQRVGFKLPKTWQVNTGGGGTHYYYLSPRDEYGKPAVVRSAQRYQGVEGIDVRADGGYIIAPPSIHRSGKRYAWEPESLNRLLVQWPTFPEWQAPKEYAKDGEKFPEGTRRRHLTSLAGAMRRYGADAEDIATTLYSVNSKRCVPVLPSDQVDQIVRGVSKTYGPQFYTTDSAGSRESGDSGDSSDSGGRSDEGGVSESRALRGKGEPRYIRSGAWYLGRGR